MRVRVLLLVGLLHVAGAAHAADSKTSDPPPDPHRPAAIVVQNVPVVPGELVERLRRYQEMRSASFRGWDPGGRGMLVQTRFGDTSQLHRVHAPGGRREQVTFFDEPTSGRPLPRNTSGRLLVENSAGGSENDQIRLLDPRTGRADLLTDGRSKNVLQALAPDGSRAVVASNRRNGRDTDLLLVDPRRTGPSLPVFETNGEFWMADDFVPGRPETLLMHQYVSITNSRPALLSWRIGGEGNAAKVVERQPRPIPYPQEAPARVACGPLRCEPDGKSALVATDAWGEFRELARLDLRTFAWTRLAPDLGADVDEIEIHHASGRTAFTLNRDGTSELHLLEPGGPKRIELPRGIVGGIEFSPSGTHLGFTFSPPDAPSEAYSLRVAGEGTFAAPPECTVRPGLLRWTFSETGGLDPARFRASRAIRFATFDGRNIPADVLVPAGASAERRAPVLLVIHGGPESQSRPYFSGLDQFYADELGIAVIRPNVRGSAGYGKTYLGLDDAEKREDSVKDVGALLDWIAKQPDLDAGRVAVSGGSYGGYMVLSSLMHYSDRIRAGVDVVGVTSFETFLKNTSAYRRDLRRAEYGDERDPKMQAVFDRIDPAKHADRIRSALLVAHGRNDPRVPFSEAEQIVARVRAAGGDPWTVYADNEGHGFGKKANRDYLTAVTVLFLQKHFAK
jgi:dipeptidyl aminopeptidase/acylaminoacyl peptidase